MVEFDPAENRGRHGDRVLGILHSRLLIHQRKDLLSGGHGGLQGAKLIRKGLNRLKEGPYIAGENKQCSDGNHVSHHKPAAEAQHHGKGDYADQIDQRLERAIDNDLPEIRPEEILRAIGEFFPFLPLPVKNLD